MAELLIPIAALGGLVLSMKDDKECKPDTKESYANMKQQGELTSYPIPNITKEDAQVRNIHSDYTSSNDAASKYFNQKKYFTQQEKGRSPGNNIQQVYSLTGNYVDESDFKHNNMTPFYGGKTTQQPMQGRRSDSVLDNMVGGGSYVQKKKESAPLFKPEDNVQWSNGQPNMNDFYSPGLTQFPKQNNISHLKAKWLTAMGGLLQKDEDSTCLDARDHYMPRMLISCCNN